MRALGELILYRPVSGSFTTYADEFIGAWAGFMTGWSYWLFWFLAGVATLTAIGIYTRFWFPWMPQWVPPLISLVLLYVANMRAVRSYGEIEFWISLIKIIAILALIATALVAIMLGVHGFDGAKFSNLWSHGGLLPMGASGMLTVLPIATVAFGGIELIGVTAGEAQNPRRTIPHAVDATFCCIMVLYIGALVALLSLVPWDQLDANESPFVIAFKNIVRSLAVEDCSTPWRAHIRRQRRSLG
jgi:AAT family amino acid transporter/D-serine/D-alanine/glycine transporter